MTLLRDETKLDIAKLLKELANQKEKSPGVWAENVLKYIESHPDRVMKIIAASGYDSKHIVKISKGYWVLQHSLECRLSGKMIDCGYIDAVDKFVITYPTFPSGKYEVLFENNEANLSKV